MVQWEYFLDTPIIRFNYLCNMWQIASLVHKSRELMLRFILNRDLYVNMP